MRISRIYTSQPLSENTTVHLDAVAAHYVANVLRMKTGCPIVVFNGEGGEYTANIQTVNKKAVIIDVKTFVAIEIESPLKVCLGVCLIKNDRMDWLLQKATELGVDRIVPLFSEYTDVKLPKERQEKKILHWQQIAINACQQSGRVSVPHVEPPQPLAHWVGAVEADCKLVLHPYQSSSLNRDRAAATAALLVGPEGGLTDDEVALSHQHQFISMSLGPRILRAETAPLTALSILQHVFGDF